MLQSMLYSPCVGKHRDLGCFAKEMEISEMRVLDHKPIILVVRGK